VEGVGVEESGPVPSPSARRLRSVGRPSKHVASGDTIPVTVQQAQDYGNDRKEGGGPATLSRDLSVALARLSDPCYLQGARVSPLAEITGTMNGF
jgi:hypothetical protein